MGLFNSIFGKKAPARPAPGRVSYPKGTVFTDAGSSVYHSNLDCSASDRDMVPMAEAKAQVSGLRRCKKCWK